MGFGHLRDLCERQLRDSFVGPTWGLANHGKVGDEKISMRASCVKNINFNRSS